jgi:hypothetical protein
VTFYPLLLSAKIRVNLFAIFLSINICVFEAQVLKQAAHEKAQKFKNVHIAETFVHNSTVHVEDQSLFFRGLNCDMV